MLTKQRLVSKLIVSLLRMCGVNNMERKIGSELVTFGHLIKRERDREFELIKKRILVDDKDVYGADLRILKYLIDDQDKEIYQKDIENFFNLTAPSVSTKLRELQSRDLIDRIYSTTDTRKKRVIVTKRGYIIDEKIRYEMETFEKKLLNLITEDEKNQLLNIIDKMKIGFE